MLWGCLQRPEVNTGFSGVWVTSDDYLMWVLGTTLGPLAEQQTLFTAKPSLQPQVYPSLMFVCFWDRVSTALAVLELTPKTRLVLNSQTPLVATSVSPRFVLLLCHLGRKSYLHNYFPWILRMTIIDTNGGLPSCLKCVTFSNSGYIYKQCQPGLPETLSQKQGGKQANKTQVQPIYHEFQTSLGSIWDMRASGPASDLLNPMCP